MAGEGCFFFVFFFALRGARSCPLGAGAEPCWPQQCAFVGGTGPGRGSSAGERVASLDVHLWLGRACGPILLVCTTASPLPSVPPRRAARRLCSLPPAAKMLGGCPGARQCSVASPAPRSHLSPCTACGLRTPERGTWLDHSRVPLQLQPLLSKFLCLMRGGEATRGAKGRARGAPSCWAGGRLFPEHQGALRAVLGCGGASARARGKNKK